MEVSKDISIEFGDCRELLKTIPDESVRLVVTSPPYNIGKKYGKYKDRNPIEDWRELISDVTREVFRILPHDGSFFLNLSQIPLKKPKSEILPLQFIGYDLIKEHGFQLKNLIIWHFNGMQNPTKRLAGRYENIIWAVKDVNQCIFNLDAIKVPYITKNDSRLTGNGRNPTDVWYFNRVNNMTKKKLGLTHPCVYPIEMIERIIKMSSHEGDMILDPFAGTGTTLLAAKNLNRKAIGFELDEKWLPEIQSRFADPMQPGLFD